MTVHNNADCVRAGAYPTTGGDRGVFGQLREALAQMFKAHRARVMARSALNRFHEMSDRELDDIGLTRLDLDESRGTNDYREAISLLQKRRHARIHRY